MLSLLDFITPSLLEFILDKAVEFKKPVNIKVLDVVDLTGNKWEYVKTSFSPDEIIKAYNVLLEHFLEEEKYEDCGRIHNKLEKINTNQFLKNPINFTIKDNKII